MTERDKKLLAIFAVIIVLGGFWFLVLGKKRAAVADAQAAKASAQEELDTAIAAESKGKVEKKRYPVSYSRVLKMGKAIPVDADYPSLLVQVSDIADDADVSFVSLTTTAGAASEGGGPSGGTTTCDVTASAEGASATTSTEPAPSGATGSSSPAGATPAQSGIGKTINKAEAGAASGNADAARAEGSNGDIQAKCATSPTLTDLAAVASGLRVFTYSFAFNGSFYNLHNVFDEILNMVRKNNNRIKVTGRLLQINSFNMTVEQFPNLAATVEMTGYALPTGTTIAAGATASGPAGSTESASVSRVDSTVTSDGAPAATIVGGK